MRDLFAAVFSLVSPNGFNLPWERRRRGGASETCLFCEAVFLWSKDIKSGCTCVRLVGEGTRQTRLQIKCCLLLGSRGWSARVPRKKNWCFGIQEKKNVWLMPNTYAHSDMPRIKRVPGVFVADKAVFTSLGFPPSVVCFNGVLEVTQGDMRAGVFTMDLLYSLSWVASENLHTNTFIVVFNFPQKTDVLVYKYWLISVHCCPDKSLRKWEELTERWSCEQRGQMVWMAHLPSLQVYLEELYWPTLNCVWVFSQLRSLSRGLGLRWRHDLPSLK